MITNFYLSSSIEGVHRILVATSDGSLYVGNIDPRDGGECRINKEFRLFAGANSILDEEQSNVNCLLLNRQETIPFPFSKTLQMTLIF